MSLSRARAVLEKMTPGPWRSLREPYLNWHEAVDWFDRAHAKGKTPATNFVLCDIPDSDNSGYLVPAVTGNGERSAENAEGIALLGSIHRQLFGVVEWAASTIPDMRCFCGIADCDACDGAMRLKALETRLAEVLGNE